MRTEKGQPGYVKARKQKYLLGAVVEFAIVIAIFVTGYIQTGSRLNLLTVVAVVGCLPAAKMLVEFITMAPYKSIEEAKLRWCFKYFILDRDYKKIEYDIFWNEINKNMINKMGTAYKYKISYSDMKAEYFEFKKKIIFAPNYKFVYSYDFLNDLNDEMVIKAYLARYDEVSLNVLYTDSDTSPKVKAILKNMGCKKINGCLFESDILSNIDKMDYLDYLGKIDERSND